MRNANRLPNMRNLGIALRILIIVNTALALAAFVLSLNFTDFMQQIASISTLAQPILLISLFLLYGCYPLLSKRSYRQGIAVTLAITLLSAVGVYSFFAQFWIFNDLPSLSRVLFNTLLISAITLYYFNLHHRAYSPAVSEARLQALQARIRPHFLFNSLNAVLSLIRSQPKQAETALEDMADLFRVLMADNRDLVPLAQEIALCRQYLALEKLRLDDRLIIQWQIDDMPPDAMIPPLVLQPLLENAVYHGIEPLANGGTITIQIYTKQNNEVHLVLKNPYSAQRDHHQGNKMALNNIKERLTLHFDLEASLKSKLSHGEYSVHITLPYRRHSSS
ncbi:MAG: histidine kinase [Methylotenera sp.]|nr:histidine kinase [Methylotenera sp.]MDO9233773.1 histidine kinase [Methylotenera sp.]MDO9388211.1 histidine kinase [Methylotenera sp.]MDP2101982.1 histidine kinase [Methylotenera sp.]MDP2282010.1 histidine kinase [Methylotenera sp.]